MFLITAADRVPNPLFDQPEGQTQIWAGDDTLAGVIHDEVDRKIVIEALALVVRPLVHRVSDERPSPPSGIDKARDDL